MNPQKHTAPVREMYPPVKPRTTHPEIYQTARQLVPPAQQALKFTARLTWKAMKALVKIAFIIPGATYRWARNRQKSPPVQR